MFCGVNCCTSELLASSYQVKVVEDERGLVHLTQDQEHLVVDELLVLVQVAAHVLLQLCADLKHTESSSLLLSGIVIIITPLGVWPLDTLADRRFETHNLFCWKTLTTRLTG